MSAQHTPGPWSWWTSNSHMRLTAEGRQDGGVLHASGSGWPTVAVNEADARLIASAPELLEALKALIGYDKYQTEYDGRMYTLCPSCDMNESEKHEHDCEFVTARQLLIKVTGNPSLFDAPAPELPYGACDCGRHFQDSFALSQHRKYSQKCKIIAAAKATGEPE